MEKKGSKKNVALGNLPAKKRCPIESSSIRLWVFIGSFVLITVFAFLHYQKDDIDLTKFENTYRSIKSIQGETSIGLNYSQFTEILKKLNTELLIMKDLKLSPKEQIVFQTYADVFYLYKDSGKLWEAKISSKKELYDLKHLDCVTFLNPPVDGFHVSVSAKAILDKYNIEATNHKIKLFSYCNGSTKEIVWTLAPNTCVQMLWELAETKFKGCNYPKK